MWRDLHWTAEAERSTVSRTRVLATVKNAPGMLGVACTLIGEAGGNIANLRMTHRRSDFFDVEFEIDVVDSKHLAHISAALRTRPEVEDGGSACAPDDGRLSPPCAWPAPWRAASSPPPWWRPPSASRPWPRRPCWRTPCRSRP